jgi:hypothetical protein
MDELVNVIVKNPSLIFQVPAEEWLSPGFCFTMEKLPSEL